MVLTTGIWLTMEDSSFPSFFLFLGGGGEEERSVLLKFLQARIFLLSQLFTRLFIFFAMEGELAKWKIIDCMYETIED